MIKDRRAKTVKQLIEAGHIGKLSDVFDVIPVTILVKYLKTNYTRLTKYIDNPSLFTMGEIIRLAQYFEVDDKVMINIVYNSVQEASKRKKAK